MPDSEHARDQPPSPVPDRHEIETTIAELDRATRDFSSRFGRQAASSAATTAGRDAPPRSAGAARGGTTADDGFEERMRGAEHEARLYLEHAKLRADQLVKAMVAAIEREAAEIRRDAEDGIRERWRVAEEAAGRYLEDARRVADGMVGERQRQIGGLSDGIVERAQSLTAGMDDADRIRRQFDDFVRALSRASDQIARSSVGTASQLPGSGSGRGARPGSTLAA
jgi:hypothetical protein